MTGIDLAPEALAVARLHAAESGSGVDYREVAVEALADHEPESFDIVTCLEMLEHVPDPQSTVRACSALVRPGGAVFFSTINRNPKSWLFAIVGAEYILQLLPRGTHEYMKFIRPSELERMCRQAGLQVRGFIGMHYNPLTRRYSLGPGVDVNYLMHTERGV